MNTNKNTTAPEIAQRIEHMRRSKESILAAVRSITVAQSSFQPAADQWSVRQVIGHLLASESGTLGYMLKKTSSGWDTLETTSDEHRSNASALVQRLASNERYKAPSVLPEPSNEVPLAELLDQWQKIRDQLELFAQSVAPEHWDKLVFRQPFAGMLNVLQTLDFIHEHVSHHLPQIQRILASIE